MRCLLRSGGLARACLSEKFSTIPSSPAQKIAASKNMLVYCSRLQRKVHSLTVSWEANEVGLRDNASRV